MAAVSRGRALAGVSAAVVVALAPVVVIALSPWAPLTGILVLGLVATLSAAPAGPRAMGAAALAASLLATAAVFIGATGPLLPVVGTALVFVLGVGAGWLAPRGLHAAGAGVISLVAYLLVDPGQTLRSLDERGALPLVAAFIGLLVLAACAWGVLVVTVVLRGAARPAPTVVTDLPYGLLTGALCAAFTAVCLVWFPGTNAWWAVMTVAVIVQPDRRGTGDRVSGRVWGTVIGGVVAVLVVLVFPWRLAAVLIGLLAALAGVLLLLAGARYAVASAATTVGVVLLTFERDAIVSGDLQRVLITIIAAGVTATVVALSAPEAAADVVPDPEPDGRADPARPDAG